MDGRKGFGRYSKIPPPPEKKTTKKKTMLRATKDIVENHDRRHYEGTQHKEEEKLTVL